VVLLGNLCLLILLLLMLHHMHVLGLEGVVWDAMCGEGVESVDVRLDMWQEIYHKCGESYER
jgi:hypothetical protein